MSHRAPFSSPPLRLYARSAGVQIGDDWPSWAPAALWRTAPETSPFRAVASIVKHRDELTKSSERLLKPSAVSLLTDGQLSWLMDVDEARSTLTIVATKVQITWAAKRMLGVVALSSRLVMRCLSESGVCVTVYTNMKGSFEVVQYTYVLEAKYTEIGYRMAPHTQPHQTPVRPQVFSHCALSPRIPPYTRLSPGCPVVRFVR